MTDKTIDIGKMIHHAVVFPPIRVSKIVTYAVLFRKDTYTLPPRGFLIKPQRRR